MRSTALSTAPIFPLLLVVLLPVLPLSLSATSPLSTPLPLPLPFLGPLAPDSTVECAAASPSTSFRLRFISYGNYTALPSQGDDTAVPRLESVSFAVANEANEADTLCAFALPLSGGGGGEGAGAAGSAEEGAGPALVLALALALDRDEDDGDGDAEETGGAGAWQPCADRKDTDGKHRFTIATGAAFAIEEGRVAVNQTWFCHDEDGRLVAYTGVARGILDMTCTEGEISGYHLRNCTAPDTVLPVMLL